MKDFIKIVLSISFSLLVVNVGYSQNVYPATGSAKIENLIESSVQYKANTPGQFWDVGTNAYGYYIYEANTHSYDLVVNKNGNIGLGIISPSARFEINTNLPSQG